MGPERTIYQINQMTVDLIKMGICSEQNFPSINRQSGNITEIGISSADKSIFLKKISYSEMYAVLLETKNYNMKLIDGALITLLYRFEKNNIIAHRLSFFPSPNIESFQNNPEPYLEDEIYLDVLDKRVFPVPLRFDFDSGEAFVPVYHPKSHFTVGQYEHCRIPVSSALSPFQFIDFIIRNFYYIPKNKKTFNLTEFNDKFEKSIVSEEESMIHIRISS
ncbi:DUF2290 domain-containing protein [Enterococcus cecorum]|uniref:DUF2290 domain-containing protein n=1 Tax=Enterococcus cecorum TaxID=44008 RepID=UPI00200B2541|nr:DUF2290 domain-containing protein [Enterococcus cecorum]